MASSFADLYKQPSRKRANRSSFADLYVSTPTEGAQEEPPDKSLLTTALETLQYGQDKSARAARAVLGLPPAPEGAPASYQDIVRGYWPDVETGSTAKNFLYREAPIALGGLAGDILLDPITYLTFGGGTLGKSGAKAGLKFAGKQIIPRAAFTKAGKVTGLTRAGTALRETPAMQALGKGFSATFRPKDIAKGNWDKYVALERDYVNKTRYLREQSVDDALKRLGGNLTPAERELATHARQYPDLLAPEVGAATRELFESHPQLAAVLKTAEASGRRPEVVQAVRTARNLFRTQGSEELERGLLKNLRAKYIPGIYPGKKYGTWTGGRTTKPLRPFLVHGKPKTYPTLAESIIAGNEPLADIAHLTAIRLMRGREAVATHDFIEDTMSIFGHKITHKPGMTVPDGFGLYLPRGHFRFYPQTVLPEKYLKGADELIEISVKDLQAGIGATTKVPAYLLPKPIADHLNKYRSVFLNDEAATMFGRAFDGVQNVWKGYATAANPGFHGRNAMSNVWQLYLKDGAQAFNPARHRLSLELLSTNKSGIIKTATGKRFTYKQARDMLKRQGVQGRGWMGADIPEYITRQLHRQMRGTPNKVAAAFNPVSQDFFLLKGGRVVGTAVENEARAVGFINDLIRTGDPKLAAQNTKKFLFDYLELAPFERNVMKRVFPFYTWMRKNLPLQFEQMAKQPGKFAAIPKVKRALSGGEEHEPYEPDYFEELYAVRLPLKTKSGATLYLNPNLPFQDINRLNPSDLFFMVTPFIKAPLELYFDKDAFYGMPINQYAPAPGYVRAFPVELQQVLGVRERINREGGKPELVMPGRFVYLLKQNPLLANVGKAVAETQTPSQEERQFWRTIAWGTGIKLMPHDLERAQRQRGFEDRREWQEERRQTRQAGQPLQGRGSSFSDLYKR